MNHGSSVGASLPAVPVARVAPAAAERIIPSRPPVLEAVPTRPVPTARALWNMAGATLALLAAVLLLFPGVSAWWSVALAVVGAVALVLRMLVDLFRFDCDFSMVHLTEEELARDLDW